MQIEDNSIGRIIMRDDLINLNKESGLSVLSNSIFLSLCKCYI